MRSPPRSLSPARECGQQTVGAGTASSPLTDAHLGGPQRWSTPRRFQHWCRFPWRLSSRGNAAPVGRRPRRLGRGRVFRTGCSARERCLWPTASPSGVADTPASSAPGFAPTRGPRPGPGARRGAGVAAGAAPAPADAARGSVRPHPRWHRELTRASPPRRSAVPAGERGLTVAQVARCTARRRATWTGQRTPERRPHGSLCPPEGGRRRDHTAAGNQRPREITRTVTGAGVGALSWV